MRLNNYLEMSLASMKGVPALLIPLTSFSSSNFLEFPLLFSTVKADNHEPSLGFSVISIYQMHQTIND
jgi:hypothetical protein